MPATSALPLPPASDTGDSWVLLFTISDLIHHSGPPLAPCARIELHAKIPNPGCQGSGGDGDPHNRQSQTGFAESPECGCGDEQASPISKMRGWVTQGLGDPGYSTFPGFSNGIWRLERIRILRILEVKELRDNCKCSIEAENESKQRKHQQLTFTRHNLTQWLNAQRPCSLGESTRGTQSRFVFCL